MSIWLRNALGLAAAGLVLGVYATPAAALLLTNLHTYVDGFVYGAPGFYSGPFQIQDAVTGPLVADVEAGLVFNYGPTFDLQATLYARGRARADYGTNGASVELNLRPANGTDRGTLPVGDFSGLPNNSTMGPHADAFSSWTDNFVINGGTGVGTANVSVALRGLAETRYGANGTIWYDTEPSFQTFGTNQFGTVNYALRISYDTLPPGLDPEYNQPIGVDQSISQPVPQYATEFGGDILTGSFVFEYGAPFSLASYLSLSGYNQIYMDYDHTATLSLFDLPAGASLTSYSGHNYPVSGVPDPVSAVPEPSTVRLLGAGLLGLMGLARKKK